MNAMNTVSRFSKMHDDYTVEQAQHVTALQEQNERFREENEKVKQHYKELYDSIKITRAKTIEKTSSLLTENEKLKAQLKGKMQCVTMPTVKPKVLAPGMYAIDVELIPPCNRNNREVHLDYLKHLKECVETLHEIVEEARIEKPLDNTLENACFYTKRSQELLEYVIGTCPKEFNKRDKKADTTPLNRNKQVTFRKTCETSNNNTQTHVEQQKVQKTNVPVIPSTGVNNSTEASGPKPRSNIKNNRILPAKSDNKKKIGDHPRNNKSNLKQENRVDSSIGSKCTWKPTGRKFTLGEQCPLTRFTKSKVVPLQQPEHVIKTNHAPAVVNDSEDNLKLAEITRKRMLEKVKTLYVLKKFKETKYIFEQVEAKVEQKAVDKQFTDIERNNLLIENENLIDVCLSNELLYSVMNDVNIGSRFSKLHDAYTVRQARCLELKAEISKLKHKIEKDDHSEMIKHFSNLEVNQLNLQLKYQNLKNFFGTINSQHLNALEF
ncbi:hypothetical protein Tco_0984493 [Tanacetum coccineum]